jgi:hypothetical protein
MIWFGIYGIVNVVAVFVGLIGIFCVIVILGYSSAALINGFLRGS